MVEPLRRRSTARERSVSGRMAPVSDALNPDDAVACSSSEALAVAWAPGSTEPGSAEPPVQAARPATSRLGSRKAPLSPCHESRRRRRNCQITRPPTGSTFRAQDRHGGRISAPLDGALGEAQTCGQGMATRGRLPSCRPHGTSQSMLLHLSASLLSPYLGGLVLDGRPPRRPPGGSRTLAASQACRSCALTLSPSKSTRLISGQYHAR
jgi:hypothetical protein